MDRSLKSANSLVRHRNVLTRGERIDKLTEEEKWTDSKSVFGLPKVAHRKMALAKALKEEAVAAPGTEGAVPGAAPAAGAAAPAPAGGKGAAPAPAGKSAPAAAAPAKAAAPAGKKK
ncbi:MAG: small basic protein [Tepidisphaeraceae bacterium]